MNDAILQQLRELTEAFNRIGLQPVICGGLGIYLLFHDRSHMVRATQDIDLMITGSQAGEQTAREAMARTIIEELRYIVRDESRCFRFTKAATGQLDILTPPLEAVAMEGGRVKLVRTKLHGRLTPEACFIEEGLKAVALSPLMSEPSQAGSLLVSVPSPANMLILKLEHSGWRHVLTAAAFYPDRSIDRRREQLDLARRRLWRWFEEQKST